MERRRPRRLKQPHLPSLPSLLSDFHTGGNRGNGELKTWSDGAPAVSNNLSSVSLPYLLSNFYRREQR